MSNQELTTTLREIKEYQMMADDIAATIEGLKDKVKAVMDDRQADELTVDIFTVRYTTYQSTRLDTTRFKAEHSDLCQWQSKNVQKGRGNNVQEWHQGFAFSNKVLLA